MSEVLNLSGPLDVLDRAELCVAGGGLSGVAAALAAVEAGLETVLLEERGALGWEISHGLELYLTSGAKTPRALQTLVDALAKHNSTRGGTLDPVASELLLDKILTAAGVRLHFRVFAGGVDVKQGAARVTTKSGPLAVLARAFVDATEQSRLARAAGAAFAPVAPSPEATHTRAFLLCAVTAPAAPETVKVEGLEEVAVRPTLWSGEAHVRIAYKSTVPEKAESESRFAIARVIEALRKHKPGFEKASLSLSAHEPFALSVPKLDPKGLPEGLLAAGPCVLGRKPSLEERVQLGEQAAAAAVEQIRGVAAQR